MVKYCVHYMDHFRFLADYYYEHVSSLAGNQLAGCRGSTDFSHIEHAVFSLPVGGGCANVVLLLYYFSPSFTSVGGCIKKSHHEKKLDSTSL